MFFKYEKEDHGGALCIEYEKDLRPVSGKVIKKSPIFLEYERRFGI
jgi:hypothetical protein